MGSDGSMRLYRSNVSPAMNIGVLFGLDLGPVFTWLYVWLFADDISHWCGMKTNNYSEIKVKKVSMK